jgi:hypothetical protein
MECLVLIAVGSLAELWLCWIFAVERTEWSAFAPTVILSWDIRAKKKPVKKKPQMEVFMWRHQTKKLFGEKFLDRLQGLAL